MASERQIAANRRNARKSTGPRSGAGRKRASRNAYRHGLTLNITSTAAFAKQLNKLARKIAGEDQLLEARRTSDVAAFADVDEARARAGLFDVGNFHLIERASAFGELDPPRLTVTQVIRLLNAFERGRPILQPIDALATMPSQEPDRSAEAVRRALPDLRKLERYERRSAARRDRAALDLVDRIKPGNNL